MDSTQQGVLSGLDDPARSVLVAVGLTVAAILGQQIGVLPALLVDPGLAYGEPTRVGFLLSFALGFVGMAAAGAAYLHYTGRGWSYVDIRVPTLHDWKYTVLGVFAALGALILISLLGQLLGVPGADHQIVDVVGDDSTLVLYLIVLVFLFNAPVEEFLFRNVIQKRLYDAFTRMGAVVVTSVIFAAIHFPVYAMTVDSMLAVGVSLLVMFVGSVVFGWVFVKTENLVVPTLAHAFLNSFSFINLYVLIEYFPEELEAAALVALL